MTREQRRDIFEFVGLVAVVGSLIFLALEIRHSANVASGQTIDEIYNAVREIDLITFADPDLARIVETPAEELHTLDESERVQYRLYVVLMLEVWDQAIERENDGLIVSEAIDTWHEYFAEFVQRQLPREMWQDIRWNWRNPEINDRVEAALGP